jgi:hypothetical protein
MELPQMAMQKNFRAALRLFRHSTALKPFAG